MIPHLHTTLLSLIHNPDHLLILTIVNLITTAYLTGLIWTIQIVHYPLFASVGPDHFKQYEKQHVKRITYIVAPPMLLELTLAILFILPANTTPEHFTPTATIAFIMLILIWLSTWCLQVPCHRQLEQNFSTQTIHRLTQTNWIRTILWTTRLLLAIYLLYLALPANP